VDGDGDVNVAVDDRPRIDNGLKGLTLGRMRGSLAAACAAVLVGLSPAGALPLASWAAAATCTQADAAAHAQAVSAGRAAGTRSVAVAAARPEAPAPSGQSARAIWRAPGGPAPSRAPPAA